MKKLLPLLLYALGFFALSPHLPGRFSTHLFADANDGFQTYWDMWWVKKAILDLHQNPYFTTYLHFPTGTTLLAQTLHPFNGLAAVALSPVLSVSEAYNVMVLFGFAVGGWTAFLLCFELTGRYWPSVAGGAVFTFSSYHFAHAEGHMQLVSLEWLPLFILVWRRFARAPNFRGGLVAAFVLMLVLLCDLYYFLYGVMFAALYCLWVAYDRSDLLYLLRRERWVALAAFVVPTLCTAGVLAAAIVIENRRDPFLGAHPSREYAMDLLAPFVPSSHWRFGAWTRSVWSTWRGNGHENSVYVGWVVVLLFCYVWTKRALVRLDDLRFWYMLAGLFAILSLGPVLNVAGREVQFGPVFHIMGKEVAFPLLPYAFAWVVFPPLRLSGVPVRMMVIVQLVAAIVTAAGIALIAERARARARYVLAALLAVLLFEYLPAPIPVTPMPIPGYVTFLNSLGDGGAVYDDFTKPARALADQTLHERPIAYGYLTRTPTSVDLRESELRKVATAGDYQRLCTQYGFRYLVGSPVVGSLPAEHRLTLVYEDAEKRVFRLCPGS